MKERPSDVYRGLSREEVCERVREKGYKIVDFRPPLRGEWFVRCPSTYYPSISIEPWWVYAPTTFKNRLIVEKV